jgi:hypothetical protein
MQDSDEQRRESVAWRRVLASLVHTAPLAPVIAAVLTVATYRGPPTDATWTTFGTGLLLLFSAWVGLSLVDLMLGLSKGDRVDATSYRMLRQRCGWLHRDHPHCEDVDAIKRDLEREGPQWVTGEGYDDLWQRVHRMTDTGIEKACPDKVLTWIGDAKLRIMNSAMGGTKELLDKLEKARCILEKEGVHSSLEVERAKQDVSLVWKTLHSYRDERWSEIRRVSSSLFLTSSVVGITGYAMLWLVILLGASQLAVQQAAILMLTGALVALIDRLHTQSKTLRAIEDYGLTQARLVVAPLLGALAALMGVLLVWGYQHQDGLARMFESGVSVENLVIAAVFGLTPRLLLDQLKNRTEKIQAEIASTQAGESSCSQA